MKEKQTIAQQLNVKKFPYEIKDKEGNVIYSENSEGIWFKLEFDSEGNKTYYENSEGYWYKREYDADGNEIYSEDSDGYWFKHEFDADGNEIYYEDSKGLIMDNRPTEDVIISMDEIAEKFGVDVNKLKIVK